MNILNDFLSLIYPDLCQVCNKSLFKGEYVVCMKCRHHLPETRFEKYRDNPAAQVFWGRIPAQFVLTAFLYNKGNAVQQLIHNFKYRDQQHIGSFLGEFLGKIIKSTCFSDDIDMIIPIPLHQKKKRKRGFNQSEIIARGVSSVINKDVNTEVLYRKSYSSTQTRKSKYQRWENVENIFGLKNPQRIEDKLILLVDDVITTGATIEACAQVLLRIKGVKIGVGAVAFTRV